MGVTRMKKAFVFDFDDTLATTDCKVLVRNSGPHWHLKELTPAEYNSYELKENEYFDYAQFQCGQRISEACATLLIDLAKEVHDENHDVYILTARSSVCADAIEAFLALHGIQPKFVFCVGDTNGSIAKEKSKILLTIMQGYNRVYFYDDDKTNVETAKEIGVKSYQV
jgi:FMN phosphatase YigB (HAD superfamily)